MGNQPIAFLRFLVYDGTKLFQRLLWGVFLFRFGGLEFESLG